MSLDGAPENPAVTRLREYLRIKSVHPNIDYTKCVQFLKKYAEDVALPVRVVELLSGRPIVVMTLEGTRPDLPSILLNSHMDVVAVVKEEWKYDPFGAYKDAEGNIWGRGTQDMKSVGVMFVEAVRRIKDAGLKLKRTIHVSFVPDEEIENSGMMDWVATDDFKSMNVGCALDESFASPLKQFALFSSERSRWTVEIHCYGTGGHSSMLPENTSAEKLRKVMNTLLEFREEQRKLLKPPIPDLSLGSVITINQTLISGGIQAGVIPHKYSTTFDCRVPPHEDMTKFEEFLKKACKDAGTDVNLKFIAKEPKYPATKTDDTNPYWLSLKQECDKMGLELINMICPGGTDARFIRTTGASAFGLTALNETPTLLHNHNEHVNESKFLRGIDIYFNIVQGLANTV